MKPAGGLSVRRIDAAQVTALGSGDWARVSEAQTFPKFIRTVISEAILRHSHSHFSLSVSHFRTLVSVKSCTISKNGDRWKEREEPKEIDCKSDDRG